MDHKAKSRKCYNFSKVSLSVTFLRDICTKLLTIENVDNEQSNLFKELSDLNKDGKPIENLRFIENVRLLLERRIMLLIVSEIMYFK